MKVIVYSLTWDARNACERIGTQLYGSKAKRDADVLDWVRSYDVECDSIEELESDRVLDQLNAKDVEYHLGEHEVEVEETIKCAKCGTPTPIDEIDAKDDGTGNYTILECGKCYGPGYASNRA
jgi:hypothetical protein